VNQPRKKRFQKPKKKKFREATKAMQLDEINQKDKRQGAQQKQKNELETKKGQWQKGGGRKIEKKAEKGNAEGQMKQTRRRHRE